MNWKSINYRKINRNNNKIINHHKILKNDHGRFLDNLKSNVYLFLVDMALKIWVKLQTKNELHYLPFFLPKQNINRFITLFVWFVVTESITLKTMRHSVISFFFYDKFNQNSNLVQLVKSFNRFNTSLFFVCVHVPTVYTVHSYIVHVII